MLNTYYDIYHSELPEGEEGHSEPTLLIPWSVGGLATAYEGTVSYSVRFYRLGEDKTTYLYNMSTKPAKGDILWGIKFTNEDDLEKFKLESTVVDQIYHDLSLGLYDAATYWVDA